MKVQALPGLNVPMEDKPHDYITDAEAVEVSNCAYYQRRVSDGDLIEVAAVKTTTAAGAVPRNNAAKAAVAE